MTTADFHACAKQFDANEELIRLLMTGRVAGNLSLRDRPLEKLWGGGGEFSSRRNFFSLSNSLYEFFFRLLHEYLLGLIGVHDFFFS